MLYRLKRHPLPVEAFFAHSLVLTYALPQEILTPLLPPGLRLDTFENYGFVAIALVQTRGLRPQVLPPAFGQDFFLSGYRIFARYRSPQGRELRGLRILRSDADSRLMVVAGNLLTHYAYRLARVKLRERDDILSVEIRTPQCEADLKVRAYLDSKPAPLPGGSPFPDVETARRFAGPLPWTFDWEKETHSIVRIKGVRKVWNPQPVRVDVDYATFFDHAPFGGVQPILANAFHLCNVPYRWERGIREHVEGWE
jgi:hypothetical protein